MSTFVLMKLLESAPNRYDRGIAILTFGQLPKIYNRLSNHFNEGDEVLDIGCGTGALSLVAAARRARVTAIDINSQMLKIARQQAKKAGVGELIFFHEMGVSELDGFGDRTFDVIASGLCFSELSADEIRYSLHHCHRLLKANGTLLIVDEVRPKNIFNRIVTALIRIPLVFLTFLLTQTATHAVKNLPQQVRRSGFKIKSAHSNNWLNLITLTAIKPDETVALHNN